VADRLQVGVVGVGFIGRLHAEHFAANPHVELIGVVDIDARQAAKVAQACECKAYRDADQLVGKVDAISVAVPTIFHREIGAIFLSQGIHLLMEKPLASTVPDAEFLAKLANRTGATLLVGHQERFNSAIMGIAHRIDKPRFIEANRMGKFTGRAGDVDVITDLMIHDIDLVLAMIRSEVHSVSALGASVITDHVDIANARLEFENAAVANVTASRVSDEKVRHFRVYLSDQMLELNLLEQSILIEKKVGRSHETTRLNVTREQIETVPTITLKNEIDHFVDIILNNGKPFVSGEDAIAALQVAQLVREKIDQRA